MASPFATSCWSKARQNVGDFRHVETRWMYVSAVTPLTVTEECRGVLWRAFLPDLLSLWLDSRRCSYLMAATSVEKGRLGETHRKLPLCRNFHLSTRKLWVFASTTRSTFKKLTDIKSNLSLTEILNECEFTLIEFNVALNKKLVSHDTPIEINGIVQSFRNVSWVMALLFQCFDTRGQPRE